MITHLTSKLIYTFFTSLLYEFLAVNCQKTSEGYCPFPSPPKNAVMSAQSYLNEFTSDGFPAYERVFFICRVGYRQTRGGSMWSICLKSGRWWPETQKAGNCTREIRTRRIECQGQFRCRKDLQCIDRKLRCDCKPDCRDGTDELRCNNPRKMIVINPKDKTTGVITSPNYPFGYPKTEFRCRFLFYTETSYRIRLKFEEFALRGVENSKCLDYIKLSGIHDIYLRKFDIDNGGKTRTLAGQERRKDGVMSCGKKGFGNVISNTSRLEMQVSEGPSVSQKVRLTAVTSAKKNVDLKGYSLTWEVIEKEKASEIERKLEKDFRRKMTMEKKKKADRKKVEKNEKSRGNVVTILLPISISAVLPLFVITFLCYHKRYIYAYIFKSGRARSCKKSQADSSSLEETSQGQVLGRMDEYRLKAVENSWTGKGKDRIGRTGGADGADRSDLNVVSEKKVLSGRNFMTELSIVTGLDVSDQNVVSGGKVIPGLSVVTGQDFVSDGGSLGSDSGLLMVSKFPLNVGGKEHEVLIGKNRLETVEKSGKQEKSDRICKRNSMLGSKDDQTSVSSSFEEDNKKVYSYMKANEENGHAIVSTNKQLSGSLSNKNLDMYINDGVKNDDSNFMSKTLSKDEYDTTDVNFDGVGPRAGFCDKERKKERFHGRNSRNGNSKHCCRNSSKAEKRRIERIRDRESRRAHRHSPHREYPSRPKRIDNEMFLNADSSRDSQQTLDSCELRELKRHSPALVASVRRDRSIFTDSDSPVIQRQSNPSTHQHFTEEIPGNCRYYSSDSGTYTGPETPCRSGSIRTESVHFLQQRDFINDLHRPRYMTDSDSRESTYTETCQGCLNGYCSGGKVNTFNRIFQSNDEGLCTALEEFSAAEEYKVARALGHDLSIYERSSIGSSTVENKHGLSDNRHSIGSGLSDTLQNAGNNVKESRQGCVDTRRIIGSDISSISTRQNIGNNAMESRHGISDTDCNIGNGFLETHQSIRNNVMENRHRFVDVHHRFGSGNAGSRSSFADGRFSSIVKDRKHGSRDSSKASNSSRGSDERQSITSCICEERFVSRDSPVTHTSRGVGDYNHWQHKDSSYVSGLIMHQHGLTDSPESCHTSTGSVDYMLEHRDTSSMIEYKHGRTDSFESSHHSQSADDFDHGNRDSPYLSGHATTRFDDRGYYTNLRPTAHSVKYQHDELAGVRCHNDRSIVMAETTNNHHKWPFNLQHDNRTIPHQNAFVDNDSHVERFLVDEDTGNKEIESFLIAEHTGNKEGHHDALLTGSDMEVYYDSHCQCGLCLDQALGVQ